jgi:hypothetical protein
VATTEGEGEPAAGDGSGTGPAPHRHHHKKKKKRRTKRTSEMVVEGALSTGGDDQGAVVGTDPTPPRPPRVRRPTSVLGTPVPQPDTSITDNDAQGVAGERPGSGGGGGSGGSGRGTVPTPPPAPSKRGRGGASSSVGSVTGPSPPPPPKQGFSRVTVVRGRGTKGVVSPECSTPVGSPPGSPVLLASSASTAAAAAVPPLPSSLPSSTAAGAVVGVAVTAPPQSSPLRGPRGPMSARRRFAPSSLPLDTGVIAAAPQGAVVTQAQAQAVAPDLHSPQAM